jgi:membrane protein YqaA with SNARE-associated domain
VDEPVNPWEWLTYLQQFGYPGVFLISLIGALSIIFPIPYTVLLYALGASLDPVLLALSSGLGAALGEISGYYAGYYGRAIISEELRRKMDFLVKIFTRYGAATIFIFALTPLPDDLLFIPLGIMRYSLPKTLVAAFLGKLLMSFVVAYSGRVSFEFITILFGDAGVISIVVSLALLGLILILMFKVDWEALFEQYFVKPEVNAA